ncbi:gamma-aminobutyric acid receptor subunit alpha-5 [Plakobranchus ocellatus]|uniref:Gamma-aminobutyric acid receptor subunit alpha-5 n=1 Tax=Plakobranchus ocellatus TaxID=259542 RepID=A0AAV3ZT40_9GAST|nr:gamma-aminobutyric acid receptor subunit alpha-5 [Plakobranchus ocellatus]
MAWKDARLQWNNSHSENQRLEVNRDQRAKLWTPDLYFHNEKRAEIHNVLKLNKLVQLESDGTIRESTRCRMSFEIMIGFYFLSRGKRPQLVVWKSQNRAPMKFVTNLDIYNV